PAGLDRGEDLVGPESRAGWDLHREGTLSGGQEDRMERREMREAPDRILGSLRRQLRRDREREAAAFVGEVGKRSGRFAVVGDLQRTSGVELWRESNAPERRLVVSRLAEERPDFVAVLGDLVFHGSSPIDWAEFDDLTEPLRSAAVPVLPVLGNHDYWL